MYISSPNVFGYIVFDHMNSDLKLISFDLKFLLFHHVRLYMRVVVPPDYFLDVLRGVDRARLTFSSGLPTAGQQWDTHKELV